MEFAINKDILLKSISRAIGIIEKKTTLPILSNILIEAKNSKIKITATDLDIIYSEEIPLQKLKKEGSTTTSAIILYDILRKLEPNDEAYFSLQDVNKLGLISGNSKFNLLCIPPDNFPLADEDIKKTAFEISSPKMLKLLNKSKISISNDETRHYLNGIYLHKINLENKFLLTGVATDSHRLSSSSIEIDSNTDFEPIILPKKTIFQLISLLEQNINPIKISNTKSKIKFEMDTGILISKVIDGKFDWQRELHSGASPPFRPFHGAWFLCGSSTIFTQTPKQRRVFPPSISRTESEGIGEYDIFSKYQSPAEGFAPDRKIPGAV